MPSHMGRDFLKWTATAAASSSLSLQAAGIWQHQQCLRR